MRLLLLPILFFSVSLTAQKKEKKLMYPKKDSVRIHKLDPNGKRMETSKDDKRNMYRMPTAKPNDSMYSRMRSKKKDSTDYKILNSVKPEESR